ncbi:MAG: DUF5786 family protein [Halobacteriota archaeon]
MGFGSYDESEQENRRFETDQIDESEKRTTSVHDGEVSFEYGDASSEDLLAAYEELKDR